MKDKESYIKVCPKCSSSHVVPDLSKDMIAWGGSTRSLCKECNFSSIVFPEIKREELRKFKEGVKDRTKEEKEDMQELTKSKGFTHKPFIRFYLWYYAFGVLAVFLIVFSERLFGDKGKIIVVMNFLVLLFFVAVIIKGIRKK